MISLNITGRNYQLTSKIKTYVNEKIGELDRYLPKALTDLKGIVVLEEDKSGREDNQFVCEVTVNVPGTTLQAKEATSNIYAAVDIVEAKLKSQVLKYKDKNSSKQKRGLFKRLLQRQED